MAVLTVMLGTLAPEIYQRCGAVQVEHNRDIDSDEIGGTFQLFICENPQQQQTPDIT